MSSGGLPLPGRVGITAAKPDDTMPAAKEVARESLCETDVPIAIQQFRHCWRSGSSPDVTQFVHQISPVSLEVLAAILRADQYARWEQGKVLPAEWYLKQFPQLADSPDASVDVIYTEYLQAERYGVPSDPGTFLLRFPEYRHILADQFALHGAIFENPSDGLDANRSTHLAERSTGAVFPKISDYEVIEEIGRGGMGVVYKAHDTRLKRTVALKLLLSGAHASPAQFQRFRVEAEAAARLQHANIVQVFEIGEYEQSPFLALEYISGGSLADRFQGRPQPPKWSAALVEQIARAVDYAHQHGVIHRDLKPANVLLAMSESRCVEGEAEALQASSLPTPKITDFGLAKLSILEVAAEASAATRTGDVLGTPGYMSPEQASGKTYQVDFATDIYALGAILYDLLTGRPPFSCASPAESLRQLSESDPIPPSLLVRTVPTDLQTICLKCLEKEPRRRYASSLALAEDLARYLADVPILARRTTILERAWRWCRRNPTTSTLAATVVLLGTALAMGALVSSWIRTERDYAVRNLRRAQRAEVDSRQNLQRAREAENDAKIQAHLTQAIVDRKRGAAGHRNRSLDQIDQALALQPAPEMRHELRNELIASLAQTDVVLWKSWECTSAALDFDPAFQRVAQQSADGVITIRKIESQEELLQLKRPAGLGGNAKLKFSPDGKYLASFTFDGRLIVWELDSGKLLLDDVGCVGQASFDFSTDSSSIVCGHDRELITFHLPSAVVKSRFPLEFAPWCVACGPAEDLFAVAPISEYSDQSILLFSQASGKVSEEFRPPAWVHDITWHPDGRSIALGCADKVIYVWDRKQKGWTQRLAGSTGQGIDVAYSHDGKLLASTSWSHELMLWDAQTGETLCSPRPGPQSLVELRFSHDDRQLACFREGSNVGIYEIIRSDIFRYVLSLGDERFQRDFSCHADFHPDGKLLAIVTSTGLGIWDYAAGRELASAPVGALSDVLFLNRDCLLTQSTVLSRWRIDQTTAESNLLHIAPPDNMGFSNPQSMDVSLDGKTLAIAQIDGAIVVRPEQGENPLHLGPHDNCHFVSLTGDGSLVATGTYVGSKVKVWDSKTGALLATLPVETTSTVHFSPDGRWLATTGGGGRLWKVGTWEEGPPIGSLVPTFSPDGRIFTAEHWYGYVRLMNPDTGLEYARLEHPKGYGSGRYTFSPDGTQLVALNTGRRSGHAWDLGRIREQLSARGLDWDLPPYRSAAGNDGQPLPKVEFIAAAPDVRSPEEVAQANIDRLRESWKANPDDSGTCNGLAWALVMAPEPLRRAEEAVELAEKAMRSRPSNPSVRNTLGVAYYRAQRYREAADCLSANLPHQDNESLPYDLYFLAMSYHRLGETGRAQDYLLWANRLVESHGDNIADEVAQFRAEAEELIGKDERK